MQSVPGQGLQILKTRLNLRTQIKETGNSEKDISRKEKLQSEGNKIFQQVW